MDHAIVANQANKVFHGLVQVFLTNELSSSLLTSMKKPVTLIQIGTNVKTSSFRQSAYLSGGDATPTAATNNITLTGAVLAGTILRIVLRAIPLGSGATLADGPFYNVVVEYTIQASATLSTAATGFKTAINAAIAGTSLTNARVYVENTSDFTKAQIATGLALKYAAASGTSPNIVINGAATGGTTQNGYDFTVECLPKAPGIISYSTDGYVTLAGVDYLGASLGANLNLTATTQPVVTDQAYTDLDKYLTATAGTLTLNALEDRNEKTIRELSQIAGVSSTDTYSVIAPNFFANAPTRAVILQYDSQEFPGNPDFAILRSVKSFNLQFGREKTHKPIASNFELIASDTLDICHFLNYRPSITA